MKEIILYLQLFFNVIYNIKKILIILEFINIM